MPPTGPDAQPAPDNATVYEHFAAVCRYVPAREWERLERDYEALCARVAGDYEAARIAAVDITAWQRAIEEQLRHAIARAMLFRAPAIYSEYDPDNDYGWSVALCKRTDPGGGDVEWARDAHERHTGPQFPRFSQLAPDSFDAEPGDAARHAYLAARTYAAFARAADAVDASGVAVYLTRHDDWDSLVALKPVPEGQPPDFSAVTDEQRAATLAREREERTAEMIDELAPFIANDQQRDAVLAIGRAGGRAGRYYATETGIEWADLSGTDVEDDFLADLARLPRLRVIDLSHTRVTDAGLRHLVLLRELTSLRLAHTAISDAGTSFIETMCGLETLDLGHTTVTDAGLDPLRALTKLKDLTLTGTATTKAGREALGVVLPETSIHPIDVQALFQKMRDLFPGSDLNQS